MFFSFFTPRYLKHAKLLHKGVTRFINYKRDVLPQAKLDEICTLRASLEDAMRARDSQRIDTLSTQINTVCEKALPEARQSELAENIEVFFVAIVIALGIRSYIAQPFKIPTGSMQPTLYGLVAENTEEDPTPNILSRATEWFKGRSYFNVVAKHSGYLLPFPDALTEHSFMGFFAHCRLHYADGKSQWIWAPMRQLATDREFNLGFEKYLKVPVSESGSEITPDAQAERRLAGSSGIQASIGSARCACSGFPRRARCA
jgi:signal peptidase I